jgi:hypothetical protein
MKIAKIWQISPLHAIGFVIRPELSTTPCACIYCEPRPLLAKSRGLPASPRDSPC